MPNATQITDPRISSKSTLRILPESSPLHAQGPFVTKMKDGPADHLVPRALRGLAKIVDGGLCHRCGSCVGICPTGVLGLDELDYPTVVSSSACTDCDLCIKVCPGDEFNFHAAHQELFGNEGAITSTHGEFKEAAIAYATDSEVREHSTSGGLVTALLLSMLESGQIDGALVVASDDEKLWKGKPILARTREEILSAMKSKYAISPVNSLLSYVCTLPGRYALVGLPCQVHGVIKAAKLDARIQARIVLTIGLFCHAATEHEAMAMVYDSLGDKKQEAKRFISRIGKHPGTPHIELKTGGYYPVYSGERQGYRPSSMEMLNIIYRLYTPARCLTCFDSTSEFADIAVGDPWMAPPEDDVDFYKGWSFALLRTERGQRIFDELVRNGKAVSKVVTRREALNSNHMMATEKRWRAFRIIETQRRQGKSIPAYGVYGFKFPRQSGKQFLKTEIHMFTHMGCFLPHLRPYLLRFMLGPVGYWLLRINNKRRNFRHWRRDTFAKVRRTLFGRT